MPVTPTMEERSRAVIARERCLGVERLLLIFES